jgi:DNA-binding response OmpR family regulator
MTTSKLKVLVADDSDVIHTVFRRIASHSPIPFEPVRADNGRECLEILNQGDINLAFIDVNMPEMNGMEAVGAARFAGDRTFVTLMSARTSTTRLRLAHALKVYEYLHKPFTEEDVLAILRTYCRVTAPLKALIVDDSATARRIVQTVLARSIFNVEAIGAGDGESALAQCERGGFDILFLDCNMPGLDGLETLARLMRNDSPPRVIMMTSERNEDRRRKALELGAAALLYKPFSTVDIDRELHALLRLRPPTLAVQGEGEESGVEAATVWS